MIASLMGRINDCDSHEMIPVKFWGECFGDAGEAMAAQYRRRRGLQGTPVRHDANLEVGDEDIVGDVMEITTETVWTQKGPRAPGAIDMGRREQVLDAMGVDRQLIFPTVGLVGLAMASGVLAKSPEYLDSVADARQLREFGESIVRAHNDWAIRQSTARLRHVAILNGDDLSQLVSNAEDLLARGSRAVQMCSSIPPGGMSPANPDLAPLWSLFEQANVPVVLHAGHDSGFLFDPKWSDTPALVSDEFSSLEFPAVNVHTLSTFEWYLENFLGTMVLGGVFERHPALRFGVIESFADWVPNFVRRMEVSNTMVRKSPKGHLPMTPGQYVARNVRVTPFVYESVARTVSDTPELADVYVYSSDYPHLEGAKDSASRFYENVSPMGDDVVEKFFVTNAELLLPA